MDAAEGQGAPTVFEARQLRHPCTFMTASAGSFVSNDITLGGASAAPFILLTGASPGPPPCRSRMLAAVPESGPAAPLHSAPSKWRPSPT